MAVFTSYNDILNAVTAGHASDGFFECTNVSALNANLYSTGWGWTGNPVAGSWSGSALNAQVPTQATAGAIILPNSGGSYTQYLTTLELFSTAACEIIVVDRLLYYPGIDFTSTSVQNLTNTNTLTRYTSGTGIISWLEVTTAFTAQSPNFSWTYTDGDAASQTVGSQPIRASAPLSTIPMQGGPFLLQASGGWGVKSVQSVQLSAAMGSGAAGALVLGKEIGRVQLAGGSVWTPYDLISELRQMPRIYDDACLSFLITTGQATGAAAMTVRGRLHGAWI